MIYVFEALDTDGLVCQAIFEDDRNYIGLESHAQSVMVQQLEQKGLDLLPKRKWQRMRLIPVNGLPIIICQEGEKENV